ncbi:MAG: preprotein translocase subunit SecE [Myxococcales bacterium]|nr:preprotein translocase subunit SecE [Myxococcales bacterium]MCB9707965.1 preprotein translocase subunit SecE [Myxococcales bacterium]
MVDDTHTSPALPESAGGGIGPRSMGIGRYVQFAFLVLAIVVFWFSDRLFVTVWAYFQEPDEQMASALAAVTGIVTAILLYRTAKVRNMADEVAVELVRVTWPDRKETRYATLVVLIASAIAAVLLGLVDAMWTAVTDFIYTGSVPIG